MSSDETQRQDVTPPVPAVPGETPPVPSAAGDTGVATTPLDQPVEQPPASEQAAPQPASAQAVPEATAPPPPEPAPLVPAPVAPGAVEAYPSGEQVAAAVSPPASAAAPASAPRPQVRLNPTVNPGDDRPVPTVTRPGGSPAGEAQPVAPLEPAGPAPAPLTPVETPPIEQHEAEQHEAAPRKERVDIPRDADIDAEMAAEIEAAMASGALNPAAPVVPPTAEGEPAEKPTEETLERGQRLTGKVSSIHGDDVFLELGFRMNGVVQGRQFEANKKPEVGQTLEVVVDRADAEQGLILCNLPRALRKPAGNWDALSVGQVVDCMVTKTNKGGLEVTVSNLRGFLPAGQVDLGFVQNLESFVGQKLRVQVTEVNPKKRNLVVSRRALLMVERREAEENLWKTLEVGQKFSGRVKTIKDYGAFVDIGGVDGFLHIGEISWTRLKHPSDVLSEGQPIEVAVISLDPEKKKIGLGMRQLAQNPWATATAKYGIGTTVSGTVTRTADFGAFVQLEPGLEGLIHISEMDYKRVRAVTDVVKEGQTVEAKVLEVDPDRKRISLSLKALKDRPEEATRPAEENLAPSGGESYVPRRKAPLKGGTGDKPGGLFGNPRDFH